METTKSSHWGTSRFLLLLLTNPLAACLPASYEERRQEYIERRENVLSNPSYQLMIRPRIKHFMSNECHEIVAAPRSAITQRRRHVPKTPCGLFPPALKSHFPWSKFRQLDFVTHALVSKWAIGLQKRW